MCLTQWDEYDDLDNFDPLDKNTTGRKRKHGCTTLPSLPSQRSNRASNTRSKSAWDRLYASKDDNALIATTGLDYA